MRVHVVLDDFAGVPMEVFSNEEDAETFCEKKYVEGDKYRDPCLPVIYIRTLFVREEQ